MARASYDTLLSLDRWAAIMGIQPAAFNSGVSTEIFPGSLCDPWFQYAWQGEDAVSREDLALEIAKAEEEIANFLGWWPAPRWISQDVKMYGRPYRPDTFDAAGYNVRGMRKSIKTTYGKIIEPGQRSVDPIEDDLTLNYTADDADDYSETATVTATTTYTDPCEIKVYFAGHDGDPEWEIRPARTKEIAAGTFTATFYSWQLIDPANWEAFPTADTPTPTVNLDGDVYVDEVEVYREYNDPTAVSAVLYWEGGPETIGTVCCFCGGSGCAQCTLTVQEGCSHIRDAEAGFLVPLPGTYDTDEAQWEWESWSICRDPDQIKVYYYCGMLGELNRAGRRCDGLSDDWARIIAHLAAARLPRPVCSCGSAGSRIDALQVDLSQETRESRYTVLWQELANPFGTRKGEMEAWRFLSRLVRGRQAHSGAVL